jgi:hypothetical protein
MTVDELNDLPRKAKLMETEEFASYIAARKEAGRLINIESAELKGWWCFEGDPYGLHSWSSGEVSPHYFVRDAESRGWVWQNGLPEDKRAAVQARIDEHNRRVEAFYADRRAAGRLIDTETCQGFWHWCDDTDPYGIDLASYGEIGRNSFVRNKKGDDWVWIGDLPKEKRQALDERAKRERLAGKQVIFEEDPEIFDDDSEEEPIPF